LCLQGSFPALKDGVAVIKVTDSASLVDLMKAVEAGDMAHAMKELGHLMGGDAAAVSAVCCKCLCDSAADIVF
jgi:hypothetical protein